MKDVTKTLRKLQYEDKNSTRQGFGEELRKLGSKNKKIVALTADLKDSTKIGLFADKYPSRFVEAGIAEQNMVNMAVGLSLVGKIPVAASYASFTAGRAWEQIRNMLAANNANVKIAASHAGLITGEDGESHQALEDIAAMRPIPNMNVIVPCDYDQAKKAAREAVKITGPVYLRMGRAKMPKVTTSKTPFKLGEAQLMRKGSDLTIFAAGIMVHEALKAAELLADHGVECRVVNIHTIKPLDEEAVARCARETGAVVTAEEHQISGGLGGAVAEVISEKSPAPLKRVGVNDSFGESGKYYELLEKYGLTYREILDASLDVLKVKWSRA